VLFFASDERRIVDVAVIEWSKFVVGIGMKPKLVHRRDGVNG